MQPSSIRKFRSKLQLVERSLTALKAELDLELQGAESEEDAIAAAVRPVSSGLSSLLSSGAAIESDAQPYDHFFPGVYCSRNAARQGNEQKVRTTVYEKLAEDGVARSSLLVRSEVSKETPSEWMALESKIDLNELLDASGFAVDFITMLLNPSIRDLGNMKCQLQVKSKEENVQLFQRSFPLIQAPIVFKYSINQDQMSQLKIGDATALTFQFFFPCLPGTSFDALFSHFEVSKTVK